MSAASEKARAFAAAWRLDPQNSDAIYSLMRMEGEDDAREVVEYAVSASLLDQLADEIEDRYVDHELERAEVNRLAQYLYEEIDNQPSVRLEMPMTGKAELVDALTKALERIGIDTEPEESGR